MLTNLKAAFSPVQSAAPLRIKASDVNRLEKLAALLEDTKSSDGTQVRLSGGYWKLKDSPGPGSVRARLHQRQAVEQNAVLFTRALAQRRCAALAPTLLRRIRGSDGTPLSKGQLRLELRALKWIDTALSERLDSARASELVLTLLDDPELCRNDMDLVVRVARLMASSEGMAAQAAVEAASTPPHKDEFRTLSAPRELKSIQALLASYLSPPSCPTVGSLASLLDAVAPSDPEDRQVFAQQLSIRVEDALPRHLSEERLPDIQARLNELALVLARYLMPPAAADRDVESLFDDHFLFVQTACSQMAHRRSSEQAYGKVLLQLTTTVLLDGEQFAHAHAQSTDYPAILLRRRFEPDSILSDSVLWATSTDLSVPQLSVLGRALALQDPSALLDGSAVAGLPGAAWTQLAAAHGEQHFPPARSVLMAGCLVAACTGRDPIVQRLAPWTTTTHTDRVANLEHHLQGFEPGLRERCGKLFALGVQMVEDPLCVFGPPAGSAAADAPLFTQAEALDLLADFYQIAGLFSADPGDPHSGEAHLRAIRSDARVPTGELRAQLAARLLQQQFRTGCFAAMPELTRSELEAVAGSEEVTAREIVDRIASVWDSAVAAAAESQRFPGAISFADLTKLVLDSWRALDGVLDARAEDLAQLGMPPKALSKHRMELAIAQLYAVLPRAFGLDVTGDLGAPGKVTVKVHPGALRALDEEIQALKRLWRSERIDSKSDSMPDALPWQALQRLEPLLQGAQAMAKTAPTAPSPRSDAKPAPGSRRPRLPDHAE